MTQSQPPSPKRICIVVSGIITARAFLLDQLRELSRRYQVVVIANEENSQILREAGVPIDVVHIPIVRWISVRNDLSALFQLVRLFRREHFDLVHSVTPKAGLLTAMAGWMSGVPIRLHTFTGQVWVTHSGRMRSILKTADRTIARLNHLCLVDSESQRQFLIDEGIIRPEKSAVPAEGSISGVDVERFRPNEKARETVRAAHGIAEDQLLLLYLGRLNVDKGLLDLARAYRQLRTRHSRIHLLFVGPDEGDMEAPIREILRDHPQAVSFLGYTSEPESMMCAADVFCLPSYREGFGSVVIEAAACGVPSVASRIYGVTDAVDEGRTGLLHEPADADDIARQLDALITDPERRREMGRLALERARARFSMQHVTADMMSRYAQFLDIPLDERQTVV